MTHDARRAVEAVWRIESGRLVAALSRIVRDVGLAEDLAQDALVAALEKWPSTGVPDNPGAWLMAAARNRAVDAIRRQARLEDKLPLVAAETDQRAAAAAAQVEWELTDEIGDDLLSLVFACCHPALSTEGRVALTLRAVGGLTTEEIARAHLVGTSTIAQRIVRAKRALSRLDVPLEIPGAAELPERLASVLEVIYLVFNEGYSATAGDDWTRPALCEDALRLGRVVAALVPREPEVHGLVALMEIQASRLHARIGPDGSPVLLRDQDRRRWDRLLITRGLAGLARAEALGGARGAYTLQAAIAACHARAPRTEDTDWRAIVTLYDELLRVVPSPVVELNRAVAVAQAFGPAVGLDLVDDLRADPALSAYHLLFAVRAELLAELGRHAEAVLELERAAGLTRNARERDLLLERAAKWGAADRPR